MNIFKELILSLYDFKSFKEFIKNKRSKVFFAGVVLMVIYFSLTMIVPFIRFQFKTGGFVKIIDDYIPDFELKDGTLWVEKPIEYETDGTYIYIDTAPDTSFYDVDEIGEYISDYYQVVLMDSEKVIVKNKGEIMGRYFSEFDMDFSRETLQQWVPNAYLIVTAFMVLAFIFMTALFFFGVLAVALIGMIVASCMKYRLTFGQLYQMGVYARTLPLLIKAIMSFLPFSIPMFGIINFGLSVLYIVLAIQKMKESDLQKPMEFVSEQGDYFR
ncbi:DUF1189 domain-containing protein [Lacrimispora indolis]|uniref:DUF1189 domain-containing protein n=1 Tax=Lacrimispora indolis TaxID=69825 RepID=UPI000411BAEF|nr:DUF1189 domain-containing protein [[Clostridium] methoxybenzovorans]